MLRIAPPNKPPVETAPPPDINTPNPSDATPPDIDTAPPDMTGRHDIEKVDQSISGYMGPEAGPFMCGKCSFFNDPNSCHIVSGNIDPNGCCNLFTPMESKTQTEDVAEAPVGEEVGSEPTEAQ